MGSFVQLVTHGQILHYPTRIRILSHTLKVLERYLLSLKLDSLVLAQILNQVLSHQYPPLNSPLLINCLHFFFYNYKQYESPSFHFAILKLVLYTFFELRQT